MNRAKKEMEDMAKDWIEEMIEIYGEDKELIDAMMTWQLTGGLLAFALLGKILMGERVK